MKAQVDEIIPGKPEQKRLCQQEDDPQPIVADRDDVLLLVGNDQGLLIDKKVGESGVQDKQKIDQINMGYVRQLPDQERQERRQGAPQQGHHQADDPVDLPVQRHEGADLLPVVLARGL